METFTPSQGTVYQNDAERSLYMYMYPATAVFQKQTCFLKTASYQVSAFFFISTKFHGLHSHWPQSKFKSESKSWHRFHFVAHPGMISLKIVTRETIASFLVVILTSASFSSHREHNSPSSDTFSKNLNLLILTRKNLKANFKFTFEIRFTLYNYYFTRNAYTLYCTCTCMYGDTHTALRVF